MLGQLLGRGKHILAQGGINWVWFCEIDWQGSGRGEVEILRHYRIHIGEDMPVSVGSFELIEDMQRVVCAISINGFAVAVKNRGHIWSTYS